MVCCAGRHASGPRTQFLLECLAELDAALRERGSRLFVRHGPPRRELPALARGDRGARRSTSAPTSVRSRGAASARSAPALGEPAWRSTCTRACSPSTGSTPSGPRAATPTPCSRRFTATGTPSLGATCSARPAAWPHRPRSSPRAPSRRSATSASSRSARTRRPAGRARARERLRRFLAGAVRGYDEGRDRLAGEEVSRLSPYLHFGCVSPREVEQRLPPTARARRPIGGSCAGATSTPR